MTVVRGPAVVRRRLGGALRQLRGERGLQLQEVARHLEVSSSKLSRLETGQVEPRIRDVRDLLEIYQAPPGRREQILQWAQEAKEPGWWHPFSVTVTAYLDLYMSLEAEAQKIRMYSLPVAGLLQTKAYAHMLLSGAAPDATPAELDALIEIRIKRQMVLDPLRSGAAPVELHVVLDEAALHRGTPAILAAQLGELLHRSQWPYVTIQILPFNAGFVMPASTFAIFDPRNGDDGVVVNVESAGQDAYFDSAGETAKYERMWDNLVDRALDLQRSVDLMRKIRATYSTPPE